METNDLIRRAEDLAARCERTSSVTATAFLTPAERMELQNAPSLRSVAVFYSGGGTECERTCAFFLPFYLTAEEFDTAEYISAVHFRSFFGEPGHRDYLGALLALGVRREWVGDIRVRGAEAWVFCLPSVVKTLAELDRAGRYTVRGEEIALADVPEEEVKTETMSFTVQSLRLDAVTAGLFRLSRTSAAELIRLGSVSRSIMYRACTRMPPSTTAMSFPCAAREKERSPIPAAARAKTVSSSPPNGGSENIKEEQP